MRLGSDAHENSTKREWHCLIPDLQSGRSPALQGTARLLGVSSGSQPVLEASEGHCCLIRLWENEENPETSPPNSEKGWKYTRRSRGGAVGWVASLGLCRPASWTVRLSLAASQDGGSATMSSPFLKQVFNKDKTFRPKRKFEPGTQRFELHKRAQASLNAGLDLRLAVQLPPGEELNDWVAVHVVDFFNRINLIYGTISDGCTEQSCPVMSGGPKYEYRWQDEQRFRRPTALSAPRYMDQLMDWVEVQINNEDVFPTNVGEDPPSWLPPQGFSPETRLGQWVQKWLQRRLGSRGHGNSRHAGISPHTCAPSRRSGRRGRACQGRPRGCGGLLRPRERLRPLLQLQSQQHSVFQALGPQLPASSPEDPVVTLGDSSPTESLFPPRLGAQTENSDMGRLCALFSDPRTQKAQCCPPADALQLVGTPFPKSFLQVARKILSRLFRVFVHVYIHHFDRIAQMGSEAHVNTCYKHFYYFVTEFGLIDTKELEPLEPEGGVRVRPVPARPRPILRLVEAEEGCVLPRLDQPGKT
ncbi:MOB kinase activator 3A isoform X3 [Marmota monax]|uniref:MOB kinase activator 3A isoform X3 n=2 Tax=Marmota monax TaxID=9995 RepID=UPI0026EAEC7A|nr:MOB kinase activator 3A isoform X3 [Marmota monax]